ncbi:MAG: HAD family hydrolase [Promethearchaeota archaeon]
MYNEYCVIFDMDGVLADTGEIHFESWVKMASEINVEFTKKFFNETFGQQSPTITRKLVGDKFDEKKIMELANRKEKYYRDLVKDKLKPLPGVLDLLTELKKYNFKLAVGSSGPPENVDLLLKTLKIKDLFDVIITSADVNKSKPHPDVFLKVSEKLNISPDKCIVIEDAPVGIEAARRAGMRSIALTTTHDYKELIDADLVVNDLSYISIDDIITLFGVN